MKYVYVLVGSATGFYYEQTLISMTSLKLVDSTASITLLVDDQTVRDPSQVFSQIKGLVDEIVVQRFDATVPNVVKSRSLKTSMRFLVGGDFLYVDADTVWASRIDENVFVEDVMGVLDGHCVFEQHPLKNSIEKEFEKTKCNPRVNNYINGGVLFVRDSDLARSFFEIWHEKWKETSATGIFVDMPSLNFAFKKIYGNNVTLLPGEYNAQISRSWNYFPKAKIVHFFTGWMKSFAESPYVFQKKSFWEIVKKEGLSEFVMDVLKNPLGAFQGPVRIFDDVDLKLQQSASYGLLRDMFEHKLQGRKSRFDLVESIVKRALALF